MAMTDVWIVSERNYMVEVMVGDEIFALPIFAARSERVAKEFIAQQCAADGTYEEAFCITCLPLRETVET
jgi:hypothetical protein